MNYRVIEFCLLVLFFSADISDVSCGPKHVVVVSGEGDVYSWGCGADGRLGHGDEEDRFDLLILKWSSYVMISYVV